MAGLFYHDREWLHSLLRKLVCAGTLFVRMMLIVAGGKCPYWAQEKFCFYCVFQSLTFLIRFNSIEIENYRNGPFGSEGKMGKCPLLIPRQFLLVHFNAYRRFFVDSFCILFVAVLSAYPIQAYFTICISSHRSL